MSRRLDGSPQSVTINFYKRCKIKIRLYLPGAGISLVTKMMVMVVMAVMMMVVVVVILN